MHGEEEQAGGRLADVMHVEVLGHRAGHRELQERAHGPGPVSTQPHADPLTGRARPLSWGLTGLEWGDGASSSPRTRFPTLPPCTGTGSQHFHSELWVQVYSSGSEPAGGLREQRGRAEPGGQAGTQEPLCPGRARLPLQLESPQGPLPLDPWAAVGRVSRAPRWLTRPFQWRILGN